MQVPICVVGCGGMGHRHMLGYNELKKSGIGNVEVVAVCDINRDMAELVANEAEGLLGKKPMVFEDLDKALAHPEVAAVDVVTDGSSHHKVAITAFQAGKHALVEKPLGVSVRACIIPSVTTAESRSSRSSSPGNGGVPAFTRSTTAWLMSAPMT